MSISKIHNSIKNHDNTKEARTAVTKRTTAGTKTKSAVEYRTAGKTMAILKRQEQQGRVKSIRK